MDAQINQANKEREARRRRGEYSYYQNANCVTYRLTFRQREKIEIVKVGEIAVSRAYRQVIASFVLKSFKF